MGAAALASECFLVSVAQLFQGDREVPWISKRAAIVVRLGLLMG